MASESRENSPRILFVCSNHPLSYNHTGASALNVSHLSLLLKSFPHGKVRVIGLEHLEDAPFSAGKEFEDSANLEITTLPLDGEKLTADYLNLLKPRHGLMQYFFPFITEKSISAFVALCVDWKPDLVWSEDIIANYFSLQLRPKVPVVYGHHDSRWKIYLLKSRRTMREKVKLHLLRRLEESIIRQNAFLVGGSASELATYAALNSNLATAYLPSTYGPVKPATERQEPPNVVHLGTMKATANKVGLERFLRVCWPLIGAAHKAVRLKVIGDLATAPPSLEALLHQDNIDRLGFVADLQSVMRAYDIHVIPYEHDTGGTRTRLPVALNHNQLLVAHRNACKGIAGLEHLENCLLADSLEEMTALIMQVLAGKIDYQPIADRGRQFFEEAFTAEGQLPRIKSFLSGIFGG